MRECGSCTLCCELTRVPELDKPEWKLCDNCSVGCNIYDERPQSCRDYQCAWSLGDLPDNTRPDISGFMVERLPEDNVVYVMAKDLSVLIDNEALFAEYLDRGISVVSSNGYALIADGADAGAVRAAIIKSASKMGVI